ncbi:hypothetical protein MLD38_004234 [Melastoma candidum]|uniref:Uncharacterized protein n=1 Tax=Melastoma candidum TaxID=119954 RepID=A0ACB9S5F6_9MYRT|nr:hypothetical protein MLD38_004234 [Melastoma candidum]
MEKLSITTLAVSSVVLMFLSVASAEEIYGRRLDAKAYSLEKQRLSHFRFYWHEIHNGKNPTAMTVVQPPLNATGASTGFGIVDIIDSPLTIAPEISSRMVARAQGLYTSTSQEEVALLMVMNFVFLEGEYNGSTITVMGRNPVFHEVREMPVVGGSGLFRFAQGYAELRTHSFDPKIRNANIEYNVFVMH